MASLERKTDERTRQRHSSPHHFASISVRLGDLGPGPTDLPISWRSPGRNTGRSCPLNPTDQGSGNSPYSSPSAFAGNTLLISPELLMESGLLTREDDRGDTSFPARAGATLLRWFLIRRNCSSGPMNVSEKTDGSSPFDQFCEDHKAWLDDFALFMVIKNHHQGKAWVDWEQGLRDRNPEDLERARNDFRDPLEREKFLQYLFFKQWLSFKNYCNNQGIKLIGDIPIYVNYDSADVWTHPDLFKLDEEKRPSCVAGVPPDYFCQTGQLWGNPIFRWDVLRQTGYSWWLERISHNLRLPGFPAHRPFQGVCRLLGSPCHGKNGHSAANGWRRPANDFFAALLEKIPADSLIAEDLGLITQEVS